MVKEISNPAELAEVLDQTHPVWGNGLSRRAFDAWHRAQNLTAWGRQHLSRVGLFRDGQVAASAKRYLFEAREQGRPISVLGIGAVFVADQFRRQGLARELIEAMCEDGRQRGCSAVVLFSEIGTDFYARLGFHAIPRTFVTLDVPRNPLGAPMTLVRAAEPGDLPQLADLSMQYAAGAGFALDRTAPLVEFGVTRRRLEAGLGPVGLREVEFFVSEEGHKPVSYVLITRGPSGVFLQECGDRDPTGARVGAMLEVLAAREPSHVDRTLKAWLPPGFLPPQVRVVAEESAPEVMMVRRLDEAAGVEPPVVYWPSDVF